LINTEKKTSKDVLATKKEEKNPRRKKEEARTIN